MVHFSPRHRPIHIVNYIDALQLYLIDIRRRHGAAGAAWACPAWACPAVACPALDNPAEACWTVALCCGHGLVQEQLPDSEAIRLEMDGVIRTGCERRGSRLKK